MSYNSFQISKINGCSLELIGQLPFDFERGACTSLPFVPASSGPESRVMLCFGKTNKKSCTRLVDTIAIIYRPQITRYLSYNGKDYFEHLDAVYEHYYTSIGLLNASSKILAVGGYNSNSVETETFETGPSDVWTSKAPFPYCSN